MKGRATSALLRSWSVAGPTRPSPLDSAERLRRVATIVGPGRAAGHRFSFTHSAQNRVPAHLLPYQHRRMTDTSGTTGSRGTTSAGLRAVLRLLFSATGRPRPPVDGGAGGFLGAASSGLSRAGFIILARDSWRI